MTATNICSNFGGMWDSPPLEVTSCYGGELKSTKR